MSEVGLEEENELLRQRLAEFIGSDQELGVLVTLGRGMTQRLAMILHILVRRAPAVVSKQSLHTIFYSDREDGGPEPVIFSINVHKLRKVLHRVSAKGKINTIWNVGYVADPELVRWVKDLYEREIPQEK